MMGKAFIKVHFLIKKHDLPALFGCSKNLLGFLPGLYILQLFSLDPSINFFKLIIFPMNMNWFMLI